MIHRKKKRTRKKVSKKKGSVFVGIVRFGVLLFLLLVFVFSVGTVGYVIFFRTVYAQQILPSINSAIVDEELSSPVHLEPVQEVKSAWKTNFPGGAVIVDNMVYHESTGKKSLV